MEIAIKSHALPCGREGMHSKGKRQKKWIDNIQEDIKRDTLSRGQRLTWQEIDHDEEILFQVYHRIMTEGRDKEEKK